MEEMKHIVKFMLQAVGEPWKLSVVGLCVCLGLPENKPGILKEGEDYWGAALLSYNFLVEECMVVLHCGTELVDVPNLVQHMDLSICLRGMHGVDIHDIFLKLSTRFGKEALVISAGGVERLEDVNAEVCAHAGVMEWTCLEECTQDDGCKRRCVDHQGKLHVVEESITGGHEAFVVAVDPHLIMELTCGLGMTVREDLQKIGVECARDKGQVSIGILVNQASRELPMY